MVDIASIKVKLIIGLVVVGIIGGLGFALNYQMDKVDKLQIKVNTLTEANKTLTDTIETNKKLDKISDDIQLKLDTSYVLKRQWMMQAQWLAVLE